jgi:hypothetical protein
MDSTVPADLLKLKTRLEAWRATRRYARQPILDEFRQVAAAPLMAELTFSCMSRHSILLARSLSGALRPQVEKIAVMLEAFVNQPQDLYARPLYGSDLHFGPLYSSRV